jgi:hypothetical protein
MTTDDPMQNGRPARSKRSLASRIVWVVLSLVVLAGLLFAGLIVAIGLVQGDPYESLLYIENQSNQTVMIYGVIWPIHNSRKGEDT